MTAFFLKYRPQTFSDLVGQEAVKKTLKNSLKAERPAHAYLFAGSRGTGKTSTARIFAKGLNCIDLQDGDPCEKCNFCVDTMNGNLIDVIEIDAASNRGIDEIRDLREKIGFMPNVARRKVYIIDEVHMLTKEAFNALLKTLEEPPDHAYFCLATTEIHKIPETITSRCQTFLFERFGLEALVDRLEYISKGENIKFERKALQLIAQKAEGGMRDAISLLEQIAAETENDVTEDAVRKSLGLSSTELLNQFYDTISSGQTEEGLSVLKTVSKTGGDFRTFGHDFLAFLRVKMFESVEDTTKLPKILKIIEEIEKALFRLKTSPIVELPLEIAVINLTLDIPAVEVVKSTPDKPVVTIPEKSAPPTPIAKPIKAELKDAPTSTEETTTPSDISAQAITQKMELIIQKSGIPVFAKKSFMTTISEVDGSKVIFYTDSEFHREKLASTNISNSIKGALDEIFGGKFTIEFLKKGGSTPTNISKKEDAATADDFLSF